MALNGPSPNLTKRDPVFPYFHPLASPLPLTGTLSSCVHRRDVRTREVGIQDIHHRVRPEEVELIRRDYTANNGWETFLEYGDPRQDILIGLLRLRKISGVNREHVISGVNREHEILY